MGSPSTTSTAHSVLATMLLCSLLWQGAEAGGQGYRRSGSERYTYRSRAYGRQTSESDCVTVQSSSGYKSSAGVEVARCSALQSLRSQVGEQVDQLNQTLGNLTDTVDSLQDRLDSAEQRLDVLEGDGLVGTPRIFVNGDVRRLCEVNSILEVAEFCREIGVRIPDPFYFHLPCNATDLVAVLGPSACPDTFWRLEPGCVRVNFRSLGDCVVDPGPDAVCNEVVFFSCAGYATGGLDTMTPGMMQDMTMMTP